jgi:hypothetical protein
MLGEEEMMARMGQTFTSRVLIFCLVILRRGPLNSTPQLRARERRPVAEGAELGPGDLRLDASA